jgi:hypothetical protein
LRSSQPSRRTWPFDQTIQQRTGFFQQSSVHRDSRVFGRSADLLKSPRFGVTDFFDQSQSSLFDIVLEATAFIEDSITFQTTTSVDLTIQSIETDNLQTSDNLKSSNHLHHTNLTIQTDHLLQSNFSASSHHTLSPVLFRTPTFNISHIFSQSLDIVDSMIFIETDIETESESQSENLNPLSLFQIIEINRSDIPE